MDKTTGTLHEDLNTFMTSWVTGVAMVSNILTDFLVPVTLLQRLPVFIGCCGFWNMLEVMCYADISIMFTRMDLTIMNLFSSSLMSKQ